MIQSCLYKLLKQGNFPYELLLTKDAKQSQDAYELIKLFDYQKAFVLPELRIHFGDDLSSFREEFLGVLSVLRTFYAATSPKILISPISSVLYPLPKEQILQTFNLSFGQRYDLAVLKKII